MQNPLGSSSEEADKARSPSSSTPTSTGGSAPLVIVSERGRHSDESRRIVRAQAARASAAQSRVTRARNREEREGVIREGPASSEPGESGQTLDSPTGEATASPTASFGRRPLVIWMSSILNIPVANLIDDAQASISPSPAGTSSTSGTRRVTNTLSAMLDPGTPAGEHRPQLPVAVPPGVTQLQQRIRMSENFVTLMGRTSFFDFDSPGVQERLHQLLFDLIVGYTVGTNTFSPSLLGHPVQDYLRIACVCLTIFQGQRANGAVFANQERYEHGLVEAWSEAMLLDQQALREPKAAEASLWAIFIISVTTNASVDAFLPLLHGLLQDLQLENWQGVRSTLLDFILPVSFLDEPCRAFYTSVRQRQPGGI